MTTRERLHALVEALPDSEAYAALRFVEYLRQEASDPLARVLSEAPMDDEPLSAEDAAAFEEAERDWQEGCVLTHEQARLHYSTGAPMARQNAASAMTRVP